MYCLNSSNIVVTFVCAKLLYLYFRCWTLLFGLLQNCWWQQAAAVNGSPKIPNKYQYFKNVHRKSLSLWKERSGWILWLPKLPPTFLSMHCSDNCYAFFLETEYSLLGRHILTFKVVFRICIIFMILSSSLCCYTFLVEKNICEVWIVQNCCRRQVSGMNGGVKISETWLKASRLNTNSSQILKWKKNKNSKNKENMNCMEILY